MSRGRRGQHRISPGARIAGTALHWGAEPFRSVRIFGPLDMPDEIVELGRLVRIELARGHEVVVDGGPVWLATDVDMLELYLVAEVPIRSEAPSGSILAITYDTTKAETMAHWRHRFHRRLPMLHSGRFVRGGSRFTIDHHGINR